MTAALFGFLVPLALLVVGTIRSLRRDLNLGDEGYLVYGTLALMRGEVPIRDFRAYDPGRYLWCALFFWLFGKGFVTARIAMAFLSGITVVLVVYLSGEASGSPLFAGVTGCLAVLWMHPNHKQGEMLFSVICVAVIVMLSTSFSTAIGTAGLILAGALYGHNILVYMVAAIGLFAVAQIAIGVPILAQLGTLIIWLAFGSAMILAISALVPGYISAFVSRKIRVVLTRRTANLPLPKPWLWSKESEKIVSMTSTRRWAFKAVFTTLPFLHGLGLICWIFLPDIRSQPEGPIILASAVTGLAYMHHLFSRADLSHLCQVILPLLLLITSVITFVLPLKVAILALFILCWATIWFLWNLPDFKRSWRRHAPTKPFVTCFETLLLPPPLADRLNGLKEVITANTQPESSVFVVPINISTIAALGRRTAVYDFFPVYPSNDAAQVQMIQELTLTQPKIAIIGTQKMDGRNELLFEKNYARVNAYVLENYLPVLKTPHETVYLRKA